MGVESGDFVGHKRFLALFAGGMLPIISLSFLHMLVKFEEEERLKRNSEKPRVDMDKIIDIDELSLKAGKIEAEFELSDTEESESEDSDSETEVVIEEESESEPETEVVIKKKKERERESKSDSV
jgi:hypothetical protein